jgi:hypothetical protein
MSNVDFLRHGNANKAINRSFFVLRYTKERSAAAGGGALEIFAIRELSKTYKIDS